MTRERAASGTVAWVPGSNPPPDVFAVVMATGIVSVAARDHGYWRIGIALTVLALAAFGVLGLWLVLRVLTHPSHALRPARDPDVALRMFTFVAACCVLGQDLSGQPVAARVLGGLGLAGWLVLVPLAVRGVLSRSTVYLRDHAHGAWLLPSVATSGLAVAATAPAVSARSGSFAVAGAAAVFLAAAVYLVLAGLIVWRAVATPLTPERIPPDSWILMGALAICALAGSGVLAAVRLLGEPAALVAAVRALMLAAWVAASLWIPALLYAQLWRSDRMPGTLHYQRVWWSAVFPLGMYSAASAATGRVLGVPALATVSLVFFWVAFTVWLLVGTGLLHAGLTALRLRIRPS